MCCQTICFKVRSNEQAGSSVRMFICQRTCKWSTCVFIAQILGYARKTDGGWSFSPHAISILEEFQTRFPRAFERICDNPKEDKYYEEDLFPDPEGWVYASSLFLKCKLLWSPFSFISWPPYLPTSALSPYLQWRNGWNSCQQMTWSQFSVAVLHLMNHRLQQLKKPCWTWRLLWVCHSCTSSLVHVPGTASLLFHKYMQERFTHYEVLCAAISLFLLLHWNFSSQ